MMKIAGHTMGVPELDIVESIRFMQRLGFHGIEVRFTHDGQLDPSPGPLRMNRVRPELVERTRLALADAGIELVLLSGYHGDFSTPAAAAETREAVRREIDLAASLGAPLLRVMGGAYGSFWRGGTGHRDMERRTAEALHELAQEAHEQGVTIVLETHAATMIETAATARRFMELVDSPHIGLIYDQDQIGKNGGEAPEEAVELLAPYIRHVHLCPYKLERRGVLEQGPRALRALAGIGYDGYISDEYPRHGSEPVPPAETQMAVDLATLRGWIDAL